MGDRFADYARHDASAPIALLGRVGKPFSVLDRNEFGNVVTIDGVPIPGRWVVQLDSREPDHGTWVGSDRVYPLYGFRPRMIHEVTLRAPLVPTDDPVMYSVIVHQDAPVEFATATSTVNELAAARDRVAAQRAKIDRQPGQGNAAGMAIHLQQAEASLQMALDLIADKS